MKSMIYNALKKVIAASTIIIAVIFLVISFFDESISKYEEIILTLLIFITTDFLLDHISEDEKWDGIEKKLSSEIGKISECQIECYENSLDWIDRINFLIRNGKHTVDTAALDSSTRSKMNAKHDKLWNLFLDVSHNPRVKFRHLVRIRENLFENLLNRILSGNAGADSYYAYYDLPKEFSFAAFEIIDNEYVAIRSPYYEGETPRYLIIRNQEITQLFVSWYENLWKDSHKITNADILTSLYEDRFKGKYKPEEQISIEKKLKAVQKQGIMEDI